MIACFDVHYEDTGANAAAIVFEHWASDQPVEQLVVRNENVADYGVLLNSLIIPFTLL